MENECKFRQENHKCEMETAENHHRKVSLAGKTSLKLKEKTIL